VGSFTVGTGADHHTFTLIELAAFLAEEEKLHDPRWVLTSVEQIYPLLLGAGIRLNRCHDLMLTEGLLLAHEGREREPRRFPAALARLRGTEPPADADTEPAYEQPTLFQSQKPNEALHIPKLEEMEAVLADQEMRIARTTHPDRFRLLVAAESASALVAAEMSHHGLPWHQDIHHELLTKSLGPRVPAGTRPARLIDLATHISNLFGRTVNPDHPHSVVRAFAHVGIDVPSARARVLREVDHPAVAPLLKYKELSRLFSANGWSWLDEWVHEGRFRPHFVVGGVVSGRWASKGGAALQIPRALRVCVRADPGWKLVVADAAQLEPRVLMALSGDRKLAEVSASADLYARLAEEMFTETKFAEKKATATTTASLPERRSTKDNRAHAKIAMLSAMYGGTAGEAGVLLNLLKTQFPIAVSYVERAAQAGERGERVRSRLGRTSPAPSEAWRALTGGTAEGFAEEAKARRASKDWGRFTRNFVVQASAAEWTAVLLGIIRQRLPTSTELVFFQHDEVIVHTPEELAPEISRLLSEAVSDTTRLMFGAACPVRFPMSTAIVDCYADAK
jgi:DNA polymerase-1